MNFIRKLCEAGRVLDQGIAKIETALIIFCASLLVLAEVTASILHISIQANFSWIENILEYAVIWIGLLGASLASRTGEHISIEIVSRFASKTMRRWLLVFTSLITVIICSQLTMGAFRYMEDKRREYWISGGPTATTQNITIDAIAQYQCPDMIVQQRQQLQQMQKVAQSQLLQLSDVVLQENPAELPRLAGQVQQQLQELQQSDWTHAWLSQQWQTKWRAEWLQVWQQQGEPQWQKNGELAITHRERVEWQNQWRYHFWNTTGKLEFEQAWNTEGQLEWDAISEDSDLSEREFQSEWRDKWASNISQTQWQKQLDEVWKAEGARQCFQHNFQRRWVQSQWQSHWKNEWQQVLQKHKQLSWTQGTCPICGKEKVAIPYTIPHWFLLMIIPICLLIITWRFFLLLMEALLLGKIESRASDETVVVTCQETGEASEHIEPLRKENPITPEK